MIICGLRLGLTPFKYSQVFIYIPAECRPFIRSSTPLTTTVFYNIPLFLPFPYLSFYSFHPSILDLPLPHLPISPEPEFVNVQEAQESIPWNRFRQPMQPGGPVRQIGLWYRPDRLHRLAELIIWNRFLGSLNVYKFGHCSPPSPIFPAMYSTYRIQYFYVSVHCRYPTTRGIHFSVFSPFQTNESR